MNKFAWALLVALLLVVWAKPVHGVIIDNSFPYTDLRGYGAVCDNDVTNNDPAMQRAISAGITRIFLPAGCLWNPPSNTIPGGLDIAGQDLLTSRIWATSPASTFLNIGPLTTLNHLSVNGQGCFAYNNGNGCPVYLYSNNDVSNTEPIQPGSPYSFNMDVGHPNSAIGSGLNGITVIERGDGGGIYGQYNGGIDNSTGSGIQASMAYSGSTGQALLVTRVADGIGFVLQDLAGAAGTAHTPQPMMVFTTNVKQHGDNIDMFNSTAAGWDGAGLAMNFGVGGAYTGNFLNFGINSGNNRFVVDYQGNQSRGGLDGIGPQGSNVTSAATIAMTGQIFSVTGSAAISTINFPVGTNFPTSTQSICIHLLNTSGATWSITTGGNIAAASAGAANGTGLALCWLPANSFWYPQH